MTYAIHVNLYAIALLVIIMISLAKTKHLKSMNNVYYRLLILSTGLVLFVDMLTVVLDGLSGDSIYYLLSFLNMLLYAIGAWVAFIWLLYVHHHLFKTASFIPKQIALCSIPMIVNLILSIISIFEPIFFVIDANNMYTRGNYFFISFVLTYLYLAYSLVLILRHRLRISKKDVLALIMFPILPFWGSLFQVFFYGTLLIWPMTALSLLIIFIFVQSQLIKIDGLTELYNQREYQDYVMNIVKKKDSHGYIAGIMLDINDFKAINDDYGHFVGDEVLKSLANLLREVFHRDDFIARIGGDEFVVFAKLSTPSDFDASIETLKATLTKLVIPGQKDIPITVSMGFGIYPSKQGDSFETFIQTIDRDMYTQKRR